MAATDASRGIGATTGVSHGIGATTGAPAKSLLGNRFVGRHPAVRAAAAGCGGDGSEGRPANKAIPEERLGRSPLDAGDTAQSQRLGRPQADSIVAAKQERSA